MTEQTLPVQDGFKKEHVAETVTFALNNIPDIDQPTVEKFLQLLHTTGTFGLITPDQIINKMRLTLKYIPNACAHSLFIIAELLELKTASLPNMPAPETLPRHLHDSQPILPHLNGRRPVRIAVKADHQAQANPR